MSNEKKYTERDKVLFQREAWTKALHLNTAHTWDWCAKSAAGQFPLPMVTRPRVVDSRDTPLKYRISDGVIERAFKGHDNWHRSTWNDRPIFAKDLRDGDVCELAAIVDVLANPTEEVEDV
jgi:hypothetical protein